MYSVFARLLWTAAFDVPRAVAFDVPYDAGCVWCSAEGAAGAEAAAAGAEAAAPAASGKVTYALHSSSITLEALSSPTFAIVTDKETRYPLY